MVQTILFRINKDEIHHATPIQRLIEHDGTPTKQILLNHPNKYFDSHELYSIGLEFGWKKNGINLNSIH